MTTEERKKIGKRLKTLRIEAGLDQIEVAKKAKVAIGTLQSIESAWREVRDSNVEKVAKIFKTSLRQLLQADETIAAADPLLADLNREDLHVARGYHHATTLVRQRVQQLIRDGESDLVSGVAVKLSLVLSQVSLDKQRELLNAVVGVIDAALRNDKVSDTGSVIRPTGSK